VTPHGRQDVHNWNASIFDHKSIGKRELGRILKCDKIVFWAVAVYGRKVHEIGYILEQISGFQQRG
jgi:hypothetical protein